jgi:hypothetical protein
MSPINTVLLGATACAAVIAGLFFLRFWTRTRDRLFLLFALAFWLMSLNWVGVAVYRADESSVALFYIIRLVAFLLILVAIIEKNRGPASSS